MTARVGELGSLVWPIAILALLGMVIILRAAGWARYISLTASPAYVKVPMQVLNFRLAPLKVEGSEIATDQLTATSTMVIVGYGYRISGKAYRSEAVFPMKNEWLKPRVSALRLMDDFESGRLQNCHVNVKNPSDALLFAGWSPYLRSHVLGIAMCGLLCIFLAISLYWFI